MQNVLRTFAVGSGAVASVVGLFFAYKVNFSAPLYTGKERMAGKVAVVTGASSGIGHELSRRLASRGATVYMLCRNFADCEKKRQKMELSSNNKHLHCRECDLASLESVRKVFTELAQKESRVDVLVNNAAVKHPSRNVTKDGIEMQLGVNHMSHFLLTNILLPHMQQSKAGRIIFVTCLKRGELGEFNFDDLNSEEAYEPQAAYWRSKHASLLHMKELVRRLEEEDSKISVMAADPGLTYSGIDRHMPHNSNFLSRGIFFLVSTVALRSVLQGCQSILKCAVAPKAKSMNGKCFKDLEEVDGVLSQVDASAAARLWLISEKWTAPRK